MKYDSILNDVKKNILILDIETSAFYSNRKEVSLNSAYEDYVSLAEVKFFGAYSFKHKKGYVYTKEDTKKIVDLLQEHQILIGHNILEFDVPILKNNGYINPEQYYTIVDTMVVLGRSVFNTKDGFSYKNRGELMGYRFKNNSLKNMAEVMGLATQKGEIDYRLFQKNSWNDEELEEIKKYLKSDILVVKQMFEKLWDFWLPFTEMLNEKNVRDLSWIKNSIASLTYRCACHFMGVDPTYSEEKSEKEEMGGFVLEPQVEEATNVFYCDWASLYPHVSVLFNLFAETEPDDDNPLVWHKNDLFEARGYYNISKQHPLTEQVRTKLKERIERQKIDKKDPMVYALKIWLNSLYGASRSSIFEKIHTPNYGWDCCLLSQQINKYTHKRLSEFGFKVIYADTDSSFIVHSDKEKNIREYVQSCLNTIVKEIKDNVPFPVETFGIKIETIMDYVMFPFSEQAVQDEKGNNIKKGNRLVKERKGRKKNYMFIHEENGEKAIKIIGLSLKKEGSTELGMKIYEEVLKPLILKNNRAKFSKEFIEQTIADYLKKPGIIETLAREFKCNPFNTYKNPESQLQAQISKEYCNENEGIVYLIANNKIGKIGKGKKYCLIEEAKEAGLSINDLDLEKINNELEPFILDNR